MSRAALLERLLHFAGPLGPFTSAAQHELQRSAWLATLDAAALDDLLSLLADPPRAEQRGPVSAESFELEVQDAIVALASDPPALLQQLLPLLQLAAARPAAIELIGRLGLPDAVPALRVLLQELPLDNDESLRLACCLGDIGDAAARALLLHLQTVPAAAAADVAAEIRIALDRCAAADRRETPRPAGPEPI